MCARVLVWVRLGLDLGFAFFWGGLDAKTFGRHTSTLETLKKTIAQTFEKKSNWSMLLGQFMCTPWETATLRFQNDRAAFHWLSHGNSSVAGLQ